MNVGEIYMYGGNAAPAGFLICDGSAVSLTTFAELFSAIGSTFGYGDGETTFNLPDLTGRVVVGASIGNPIGTTGGEETHVLVAGEMPSHSHNIQSHGHTNNITVTTPNLTHSITQPAFTYQAPSSLEARPTGTDAGYSTVSSVNATRSANLAIANHTSTACTKTGSVTDCDAFDTSSTGTGTAHDNMQPYITITHIIYTGVNI